MTGPDLAALRAQLIRHEGERLHAYQDHLGYWTIGVGRLIDARKGGGISHDEALMLLDNDITDRIRALSRALPWWLELDPVRQRALVDMAFNLGVGGLLMFRQMLGALEQRAYDAAAQHALDSTWARQVGARAQRIAHQLRTGTDVA